ncbi:MULTISPECIES: NUDIX hydrolase [unclassified Haladaptatus]|uniref:NUDIX hydrolase n=1 Tax=unclassified Haladaptatus TaxID=2622732 RepID=UPI0023E8D957|nr:MULTISPECIES: NUDIX hydrolase [unclassified Haladaptatus]
MTDDPLEWETLASETAYTCPGFDVTHEDVRLPDGTETDFDFLSEPPAVVILPFTPEGDVVLIEEWRQAVKRVNRGIPAGTMEPADDDPAMAAHRELEEETGHEAARVEHLTTVEPANGIANAVHHYFVAYDCHPASEQKLDFNESIRVVTESYDDLLAAVGAGEIRDGRAVLGTLYYEQFA